MITRCDCYGNMDKVVRINHIKDMRDLGLPSLTYSEDGRILLTITDWGEAYMIFDYRKGVEDAEIRRVKKVIVYIPYYDKGWHILEADTEKVIAGRRQFKRWLNTERIEYCGTIYNQCFDTEEHAYAYAHFGCTNGQLNLMVVIGE